MGTDPIDGISKVTVDLSASPSIPAHQGVVEEFYAVGLPFDLSNGFLVFTPTPAGGYDLSFAGSTPVINSLGCTPSAPGIGESVTCTPSISFPTGGTVTSYGWTGGESPSGAAATFPTTFSSSGPHDLQLTACNGLACTVQMQTIYVIDPSAQ